jgi:general transcription factor 3C polypeptide 2
VANKKGPKPRQEIVQALAAGDVIVNLAFGNDQNDGHNEEQGAGAVNPELGDDQDGGQNEGQGAGAVNTELDEDQDGHSEEQGAGAIVLVVPTEQEDDGTLDSKGGESPKDFEVFPPVPTEQEGDGTLDSKGGESPKDFEVFPPKSVALHRVRWNVNKGSERWLCYGGAAGIVRCQRI